MLISLVSEQIRQGFKPMILSAGDPGIDEKPLEAEARGLGLPVKKWRMKPGLNLREAKSIIRWAHHQGYELMHSHGYKFNILAGVWPRRMRPPLVTTLHGYVRAPRWSKMWLYEMLDRLILLRMQAVILVNENMESDLGRALDGSERVHIIPNGVDIGSIENKARSELPPSLDHFFKTHNPVILGVGRLSREKAFDRLIEGFSTVREDYPRAGLLIVGEGRLRNQLEILARSHGLGENVLMPGYFDNVPALMMSSSALVIPSRTEGLPIALLESMALRLPIIASAVGAMPQALDNGAGGWLIEEANSQKVAEALRACLRDLSQTEKKVQRARHKVEEAYSSSAMAAAYSDIYQRMVI